MLPKNSRWEFELTGIVQGIGLRPKLAQIAHQFNLTGFCQNLSDRVRLQWQGPLEQLQLALTQLNTFLTPFQQPVSPPSILALSYKENDFNILTSKGKADPKGTLTPDLATCSRCLSEFRDPQNRRYQYPLISCAQCGPRLTICHHLPFDRCHTSMQAFPMCVHCLQEYTDPFDRRYHAQTTSCPKCGPAMSFQPANGPSVTDVHTAIEHAVKQLMQGKILCVKGIGGFHLWVKANDSKAIARLRTIKQRPSKPLALMVPSLEHAKALCHLDPMEQSALQAYSAPIVIAARRVNASLSIAKEVAFSSSRLGLMLPYTALHYTLLEQLAMPVVATSANIHQEGLIYDDTIIENTFFTLSDGLLTHNRPIVHPMEDSVVQKVAGQMRTVRLGRGLLPLQMTRCRLPSPTLALGGAHKNHVAYWENNTVSLSGYFGDLDHLENYRRFDDFVQKRLSDSHSIRMVKDCHPGYPQHHFKGQSIYHHLAHVFSVVEEHQLSPPLMGIAWDGFGLGIHNAFWGAEAFQVHHTGWDHWATLSPIPLIGGEQAFKAPKRIAFALLHALDLSPSSISQWHTLFDAQEERLFSKMIQQSVHCPECSSMGRLFDGIGALLGGPLHNHFEGECALFLEHLAEQGAHMGDALEYPVKVETTAYPYVIEWKPMLVKLIDALLSGTPHSTLAWAFHHWCAQTIAHLVDIQSPRILVLSGGVFQNKVLTELCLKGLSSRSVKVFLNEKIPCHDGGLAFGQLGKVHYDHRLALEARRCV